MGLVFLIAAGPAILMFLYVYKKDTIEKEPSGLLWKLVLGGAVSVLLAIVLELIGGAILDSISGLKPASYILLEMFAVVAVAEEVSKFLALKLISWKHPAFDYMFDGMLYAICVAIGFSVLEDIMYIFESGLATGLVRAITFIPGHFGFAVFSGLLYSRARELANRGERSKSTGVLVLSVVLASVLHGFYDSCLSFGSTMFLLLFLLFIVAMYVAVFVMIRKASATDHRIR